MISIQYDSGVHKIATATELIEISVRILKILLLLFPSYLQIQFVTDVRT